MQGRRKVLTASERKTDSSYPSLKLQLRLYYAIWTVLRWDTVEREMVQANDTLDRCFSPPLLCRSYTACASSEFTVDRIASYDGNGPSILNDRRYSTACCPLVLAPKQTPGAHPWESLPQRYVPRLRFHHVGARHARLATLQHTSSAISHRKRAIPRHWNALPLLRHSYPVASQSSL
jgi:hypothetical protein